MTVASMPAQPRYQPRKPILGLIGSIGAGKSTVANYLSQRGGYMVDADRIGHVVLDEPEVKHKIQATWGDELFNPNGTVDRRALGNIVFREPAQRQILESIVFPRIHAREDDAYRIADQDSKFHFIVLDAAVLLEAGSQARCAKLLFVDAPRELRIERVRARNGWDEAELTRREHAQWSLERKRSLADATVDNSATLQDLQQRVDAVLASWGWLAMLPSLQGQTGKDESK